MSLFDTLLGLLFANKRDREKCVKSFLRLSVAASLTLALIASGSSGATAGQSATDLAEPVRIGFEVRNG